MITFLVTVPCRAPSAQLPSRMLSPVNHLASYMPSLAAVAPPSTSAKQAGLLENASASISAALRKACRDFLSRSILIQNQSKHDLQDVQVRGVMLCDGNKNRKRQEMRLIFKLGTSQPHGLNSDFYKSLDCRALFSRAHVFLNSNLFSWRKTAFITEIY